MITFLLAVIGLASMGCGNDKALPELGSQLNSSDNQQVQQNRQFSSEDQTVRDSNQQNPNQFVGDPFADASRFGDSGKDNSANQMGNTVAATEDATPKLASGTLLAEYKYGKLSTNVGQIECQNHPRKSECASGETVFTRNYQVFGTNKCHCK